MITEQCKKQNDDASDGTMRANGGTSKAFPSSESSNFCDGNKSDAQSDSTKVSCLPQPGRRASFSEAKIGEGQGRKRSNEPIKRKSQEKQRKSAGDEIIEQRLAALAKENNALKSQLEEQIRLNSVIVANPSLASLGNSNLPRIVFANGSEEQSSPSFGNTLPNLAPFVSDEPSPFCALQKSERSAFSVIRPGNSTYNAPGTSQQNDQTDVHAFSAKTPVKQHQNNEFARLAAQLAPFSMFVPPHPLHPHHLSPLGGTALLPPLAALCASSSPTATVSPTVVRLPTVTAADHRPPHTVKEGGGGGEQQRHEGGEEGGNATAPIIDEIGTKQQQCQQHYQNQFVQMHSNRSFTNLSMLSNLSEDNLGAIVGRAKALGNSVADVHSTSDECPLDFSKRGQQQQNLSAPAALRPKSVIISTSQSDAAGRLHLNLASDGIVGEVSSSSKTESHAKQRTPIKQTKRCPSSEGSTAPTAARGVGSNGRHWTPVIQQHKHGPSQLRTASDSNANKLKTARHTVMGMADMSSSSLSSSSSFSSSSSSSDLLPLPLLLHHSSPHSSALPVPSSSSLPHFPPTPLLQLLMLRSRIGIDEHGNLGPPMEQLDHQQQKFANPPPPAAPPPIISRLMEDEAGGISGGQQNLNGGNSANSSSSMLGTLLALPPNDCRTSPTVPASRTEFCSGLALSCGKKCHENEPIEAKNWENPSKSSAFSSSSTTTSNNEKNFSNLNSDSEQSSSSGGQNSPNSAHTSHSHTSDSPPSTLPGAGSTVTTVCGSDRTRRGSSSPTSGCSGDDTSLLVACDKNGAGSGRRNSAESVAGNRPTNSQSSPPAATASMTAPPTVAPMRMKMRNSEELERYMDRRRRNNEAAKRCRANRRAVFEYRSRKAQLLEAENGELRQEMVKLNAELEQLKALIAAKAAAARFSMST